MVMKGMRRYQPERFEFFHVFHAPNSKLVLAGPHTTQDSGR